MSNISHFIINFISTVLFSLVIYHIGEKGGYSRGYQEGYHQALIRAHEYGITQETVVD